MNAAHHLPSDRRYGTICLHVVTIAQLAEHLVVAQKAAGSSPAGHPGYLAHVAQPAEQPPCKRSVVGSNPTVGLGHNISGLFRDYHHNILW